MTITFGHDSLTADDKLEQLDAEIQALYKDQLECAEEQLSLLKEKEELLKSESFIFWLINRLWVNR